nr:hypothetical protein Iba_chr02aCG18080 [Ipomoea batatas]
MARCNKLLNCPLEAISVRSPALTTIASGMGSMLTQSRSGLTDAVDSGSPSGLNHSISSPDRPNDLKNRYIPEMDIILRPNPACMLQWRRSHDGESFTPHSTVKVARTGDDSVSGVAVGRAQSPALLLRLQLKEAPHLLLHLGKKRHRNAVVQKLKKAPSLKSRFHLLHGLRVVKIDDGDGFGGQRRVYGGVDPDVGAGKLIGVVEIHGGDPIGRSGHG